MSSLQSSRTVWDPQWGWENVPLPHRWAMLCYLSLCPQSEWFQPSTALTCSLDSGGDTCYSISSISLIFFSCSQLQNKNSHALDEKQTWRWSVFAGEDGEGVVYWKQFTMLRINLYWTFWIWMMSKEGRKYRLRLYYIHGHLRGGTSSLKPEKSCLILCYILHTLAHNGTSTVTESMNKLVNISL